MKKYLNDDGSDHPEFAKTVMDDFPDEPAFRKCRATLNSSSKLDSLVVTNFFCLFFLNISVSVDQQIYNYYFFCIT